MGGKNMENEKKKLSAYYKPYKGLFLADMVFAMVGAAITLVIPLMVRYITGTVVLNGKEMMLKVFKTQKTDKATSLAPGELFAEKGHLYVSCADSLLEILHLQQSGKKRMSAKDFINGQRL